MMSRYHSERSGNLTARTGPMLNYEFVSFSGRKRMRYRFNPMSQWRDVEWNLLLEMRFETGNLDILEDYPEAYFLLDDILYQKFEILTAGNELVATCWQPVCELFGIARGNGLVLDTILGTFSARGSMVYRLSEMLVRALEDYERGKAPGVHLVPEFSNESIQLVADRHLRAASIYHSKPSWLHYDVVTGKFSKI